MKVVLQKLGKLVSADLSFINCPDVQEYVETLQPNNFKDLTSELTHISPDLKEILH